MNEENNALTVNPETGELISSPSSVLSGSALLGTLPTISLESFQSQVFNSASGPLAAISAQNGANDTIMHIGNQLKSEDVNGHVLTIIRVGLATLPATDISGNPIYDENGNQKTARYPVAHFKEAPGYWYNGGALLMRNIEIWAAAFGDDINDPNLPKINAILAENDGQLAYFQWKNKRDHSGQKYMNIIFA